VAGGVFWRLGGGEVVLAFNQGSRGGRGAFSRRSCEGNSRF